MTTKITALTDLQWYEGNQAKTLKTGHSKTLPADIAEDFIQMSAAVPFNEDAELVGLDVDNEPDLIPVPAPVVSEEPKPVKQKLTSEERKARREAKAIGGAAEKEYADEKSSEVDTDDENTTEEEF